MSKYEGDIPPTCKCGFMYTWKYTCVTCVHFLHSGIREMERCNYSSPFLAFLQSCVMYQGCCWKSERETKGDHWNQRTLCVLRKACSPGRQWFQTRFGVHSSTRMPGMSLLDTGWGALLSFRLRQAHSPCVRGSSAIWLFHKGIGLKAWLWIVNTVLMISGFRREISPSKRVGSVWDLDRPSPTPGLILFLISLVSCQAYTQICRNPFLSSFTRSHKCQN